MSRFTADEALTQTLGRLAPYVSSALDEAARFARRLHAEELTIEHLLCAILADEEAALTRLILFAFADPETIAHEIMALAPGILVVTSDRCVPFSPLTVRALEDARGRACALGHAAVEPSHLAIVCVEALGEEVRSALARAGWSSAAILAEGGLANGELPPTGPLFRHFSKDSRRALAASARVCHGLGRDAISPGHLLIACLDSNAGLAEQSGLTPSRARLVLTGRDEDPTPPSADPIGIDRALVEFLGRLPDRAGSGAVLAEILEHGPDELRGLFVRQKVGPELLSRAGHAFGDPEAGLDSSAERRPAEK